VDIHSLYPNLLDSEILSILGIEVVSGIDDQTYFLIFLLWLLIPRVKICIAQGLKNNWPEDSQKSYSKCCQRLLVEQQRIQIQNNGYTRFQQKKYYFDKAWCTDVWYGPRVLREKGLNDFNIDMQI
jgi:hypothetical protein